MLRFLSLIITVFLLSPCYARAETEESANITPSNVSLIEKGIIEQKIAEALAEELNSDAKISVELAGYEEGFVFNTYDATMDVAIAEFTVHPQTRRFESTISFLGNDTTEERQVNGSYEELVAVPVLSNRLPYNSVVSEDDIQMLDYPKHQLKPGTVTDIAELTGSTLKRAVPDMRPVRQRDLMREQLITRTKKVNLLYKTPSMTLQTLGIAMDNGAKGDIIRVRNATTNVVVSAMVKDDSTVIVNPDI